ncbi:MAG: hypothetical protein JXX28_19585 [Deltaproteobacteria bacterium]|nr:hypothetical protein [Deltaproteobacteria bacterium]
MPAPIPALSLRRYVLLSVVGEGTAGRVYRARLVGEGGFSRDVALRLLRDEAALVAARREALVQARDRALISVDPPVRLGPHWAVPMELVEGVPLSALPTPLPRTVALELVGELARCLDVVSQQGAALGDAGVLTADRVMVGRTGQVKLLSRALGGEAHLPELTHLLSTLTGGMTLSADTPRALERACQDALAGLDGPSLREWASELPLAEGLPDDLMVGRSLVEAPPPSPGRAARRLGWIGGWTALAGLVTWGALSLWPAGAPSRLEAQRVFSHGQALRPVAFAFHPDGRRVVWADPQGLWIGDPHGGPPDPVATPPGVVVGDMAVLPDGRLLVGGMYGDAVRFWVLGEGGGPRELGVWPGQQMALSPDGRTLALVVARGLLLVEVETGAARELLRWDESAFGGPLAWRPDGRTLAMGRLDLAGGEAQSAVVLVDVATGAVSPLVEGTSLRGAEGELSPLAWRGQDELLFFRFPQERRVSALRSLRIGTREERALASLDAQGILQLQVQGPRLGVLNGETLRDAYLAPLGPDGLGEVRQLTEDQRVDYPDAWLPDGRLILSSDRYGTYDLLAVAVEGGPPEVLLGTPARERAGARVGEALVFARLDPDGWWFVRRLGDQEQRLLRLSDPDDGVWELSCGDAVCAAQRLEGEEVVWRLVDPATGWVGPVFSRRSANPWPIAALSRDGARLAVVALEDWVDLVEVEGGATRTLSLPDPPWLLDGVGWHPDGASLVLTSFVGESRHTLWRLGLDGEVLDRAETPRWVDHPVVSPDGGWVALAGAQASATLWELVPAGALGPPAPSP